MAEENSRSPFVLCVVVQTVIFGLGNVITKFAYESVMLLWCMVLRFGLALAVFALAFGPRMVRELRGAKLDDWAPTAACLAVVGATLVEGRDGNSEAPSSAGMERLVSQLASDLNAQ